MRGASMPTRRLVAGAAFALIAASQAVAADQRPLPLAGGAAEAQADGEYYLAPPRSAVPTPGTACMLAQRYVALVSAGRYGELASLFTSDAVVLEPMRGIARGRSEIDAFYSNRIGAMRPHVVAVAYVGTHSDCMVELAARVPPSTRYSLSSVDHFTVNRQGLATRMVAFARPRGPR
jgi:hypothetical protein